MRLSAFPPIFRKRQGLRALVVALLLVATGATAQAERPSAMKLFPDETLLFVRIRDAHELGEKAGSTSFIRMLRDPQLKPFVEGFYNKMGDLYTQEAEGKLGISWEELKKLPKGEVAFGVVARPEKRPALILLIDQGDEPSVANKLVDRALDFAQQKGADFTKETIGDVEVTVVRDHDRENRMFGVFERENTIVVATDPNVIRKILWHWDHPDGAGAEEVVKIERKPEAEAKQGEASSETKADKKQDDVEFIPGRTLSQNERFATILKSCRRPQDPPPNIAFYFDPIETLNNVGRGNAGLQLVVGLFPSLGIDGIMALGGSLTYSTDEYDTLTQIHVMLENPRSGVLLLPAFQPGEIAPQEFVPLASENYIAFNYSVRTTYDRLIELIDKYRFKGSVDKFMQENVSDKIGIDVPTKVFDNLKGRFTWMIGFDRPSHLQGQQHVLAAELVDQAAAEESLKTVMQKFPDFFEERQFGTVKYYAMAVKELKKIDEENEENPVPYHPFVAIMDGYVFIGSSTYRFEQCIGARDKTVERLVDSADYIRTSAVIGNETRGTTPVMFSLNRLEETLRQWYDLLTSEKTRAIIEDAKEKNKFLAALAEAMDQNKLPPFEVLLPYMSPGGGILYDTDSGYHAISFQLRSEPQPGELPAEAAEAPAAK